MNIDVIPIVNSWKRTEQINREKWLRYVNAELELERERNLSIAKGTYGYYVPPKS